MLLRISRRLDRHRRAVLLTTLAVVAVVLLTASLTPVRGLGLGLLIAFAMSTVLYTIVDDRKRTDELVPAEGGWATPRDSALVLAAVAHLLLIAGCFVLGVRDDERAAWLILLTALAVPLLTYWYGAWHGVQVVLTPDGLRAGKLSGSLVVPWAALDAGQPGQDPDGVKGGRVILGLARPDLVTRSGFPIDDERITFAGTGRDFLAAAIRHYAAHPADRAAIGTTDGLHRLRAAIEAEPEDERPQLRPRTARNATAGGLILLVTGAIYFFTNWRLDDHGLLEMLPQAMMVPGLFGLFLIITAVADHPTPEEPSTPVRPSWSRDVTDGS